MSEAGAADQHLYTGKTGHNEGAEAGRNLCYRLDRVVKDDLREETFVQRSEGNEEARFLEELPGRWNGKCKSSETGMCPTHCRPTPEHKGAGVQM